MKNLTDKNTIEPFKITWSKYLPGYDVFHLKKRLQEKDFALATLLTPDNLLTCLDITQGREMLKNFYSTDFEFQRKEMAKIIDETLHPGSRIIHASNNIPAEEYVPKSKKSLCYWNGVTWTEGLNGSTPPWLAALGAMVLKIEPNMDVLDVGFGNGYTGAFFSETMENNGRIFGIEIDDDTIKRANKIAKNLGYNNIKIKKGDAFELYDGKQKFNAIWPGCAVKTIPPTWISQLKDGGRMVIFRPLKRSEWKIAKEENYGWWAPSTATYDLYLNYWWRDVCMEVLEKESNELVAVFRLYEMDNTPFYHPKYGSTINLDWRYEIGSNEEEKLLRIISGKAIHSTEEEKKYSN